MGRYGYLACTDCKQLIWLGKTVCVDINNNCYFHIGGAEEPSNWKREELNRVIWKFLANHINHAIIVTTDYDPIFDQIAGSVMIGGDEIKDISFEAYPLLWLGVPVSQ